MERKHFRNFSKGYTNALQGGPELPESARSLINLDPFHEIGTVKVRPRHNPQNTQLSGVDNIFWQNLFSSSGLVSRCGGVFYDDLRSILGGSLDVSTQFFTYNDWLILVRNGERPRKYKRSGVRGSFLGFYTHPWENPHIPRKDLPWAHRSYSGATSTTVFQATNEWEIEQIEGDTPSTVGHIFVSSLVEAEGTSYLEACALLNEAVFLGIKAPEYSLDKEYEGSYTQSWERQYVPQEVTKSFKFGNTFSALEATAVSGYIRSDGMDTRGFACCFPWEDFILRGSEQLQNFEVTDAVTSSFDKQRYLYAVSGGSLTGTFKYAMTFLNAAGFESNSYSLGTVTVSSGYVQLSDLPVSNDPQVVERRIYRTENGKDTYFLRSIIPSNLPEPSFRDTADDTYLSDYTALHDEDHDPPQDNLIWGAINRSRLFFLDNEGNIWWANNNVDWEYFYLQNYEPLYTGDSAAKRLESFHNSLYGFFEDRCVNFSGSSEEDFGVSDFPISYGLPAQRAMINDRSQLFLADAEGLVRFGQDSDSFSAKIMSQLFDKVFSGRNSETWELNTDYVSQVVMGFCRGDLYISYPAGTNTENSHTLVYNVALKAARQIDVGFLDFAYDPVSKDLYGVTSAGLIYKIDRSYTSGSIDIELETYEEDGGDPTTLKRIGKVWIDVDTGGQEFTVEAWLDDVRGLSESLRTNKRTVKSYDVGVDLTTRRVRFKIDGTDVDGSFELYNISFEFEPVERSV